MTDVKSTTPIKETPAPVEKVFSVEMWKNATKVKPETPVKENPYFDCSSILLVHDEKLGVLPGYFVKWNATMLGIKKGDTFYHALKGDDVLENVIAFYPVDMLPVKKPAPKVKAK